MQVEFAERPERNVWGPTGAVPAPWREVVA